MFSDLAQAQLELMDATLSNRQDERRTALRELTRITTTDPSTITALAELEFNRRSFDASVDLYKNALALEPDNVAVMNQLGYSEVYAGHLDDARSVLERYRDAAPKQANPLDSLGDVHFLAGKFAEAEKYYLEAQRLNPRFLGGAELLKAAQARLLQGNLTGADALHSRFIQFRQNAKDPLTEIENAQWLFITGRRKEGMSAAAAFAAKSQTDARAYAEAQLAVWKLETGDSAAARQLVSAAAHDATAPQIAALVAVCSAAVGAPQPTSDNPAFERVRETALVYQLVFAQNFREASQVLSKAYARTAPSEDGDLRTLYAWSLVETGQASQAAPLLQLYPMPLGVRSDAVFSSLIFPRFLALRGAVLKSNADLQLFDKYAGNAPTIFKNPA